MQGAHGMYVLRIVELVFLVITSLVFNLGARSGAGWFSTFADVQSYLWLALSVASLLLIIPMSQGASGTPAEELLRAAVGLTAVNLAFDVLFLIPPLSNLMGDGGRIVGFAQYALFLAYELVFWLALMRLLRGPPPSYAPLFYALLAMGAAISLFRMAMPYDAYREMVPESAQELLSWVRLVFSAGRGLLVVLVLQRLVRGVP